MQIIVLCNGEQPDRERFRSDLFASDLFICADGGANTASEFGLVPDVIIGDFDSVRPEVLIRFETVEQVKIEDQETTDFEKVLSFCRTYNPEKIIIWGALGLRIDHSIGNMSSLIRVGSDLPVILKSNLHHVYRIPADFKSDFPAGTILSLIPIPTATGITTTGLKWPLTDDTLSLGVRNGTLNQAEGGEVSISYKTGNLILMEVLK
ncbi:MAG: thiamine diphosphokinase [Bacteroidetes bacterium]|nr:thiamine diphosphokinase [Bacteroidota bacterium]